LSSLRLCASLRFASECAALRLLSASKVLPHGRTVEPSKEYHLSNEYKEDEDKDSQAIVDEILKTIIARRRVARTLLQFGQYKLRMNQSDLVG